MPCRASCGALGLRQGWWCWWCWAPQLAAVLAGGTAVRSRRPCTGKRVRMCARNCPACRRPGALTLLAYSWMRPPPTPHGCCPRSATGCHRHLRSMPRVCVLRGNRSKPPTSTPSFSSLGMYIYMYERCSRAGGGGGNGQARHRHGCCSWAPASCMMPRRRTEGQPCRRGLATVVFSQCFLVVGTHAGDVL